MYRDLLAPLDADEVWPSHIACAMTLAARYRAFLTGLAIGPAGEDDPAVARFEEERVRRGVRGGVERQEGPAGLVLGLSARLHDLVIVAQGGHGLSAAETAVRSGRPTLVMPRNERHEGAFGRVLVAWNGSLEAARALHGALPFVEAAQAVFVLEGAVGPDQAPPPQPGQLETYLSRRARSVTVIARGTPDDSAAEAIVAAAGEHGCDLIVMGAHATITPQGFAFGGATERVLNAAAAPVLAAA